MSEIKGYFLLLIIHQHVFAIASSPFASVFQKTHFPMVELRCSTHTYINVNGILHLDEVYCSQDHNYASYPNDHILDNLYCQDRNKQHVLQLVCILVIYSCTLK